MRVHYKCEGEVVRPIKKILKPIVEVYYRRKGLEDERLGTVMKWHENNPEEPFVLWPHPALEDKDDR